MCGARCGSLTCVLLAGFLSFLVFSVDHYGTFCTNLLLIVPGLLWYVFVSSILFCFWKNCTWKIEPNTDSDG